MPEDFTIDINLDSNAKSSAQDLSQVVTAIDRVTEAENKHNATVARNTQTQIKISKDLLRTLKAIKAIQINMVKEQFRFNRENEKQDKAESDNNSRKLLQLGRIAAAYGVIRRVAHTAANAVSYFAKYGIAAGGVGVAGFDARKLGTLQYATELYGGTMQSAAGDYTALRRIASTYNVERQLPVGNALARIPGLFSALMGRDGSMERDPDKVLNNLNRLFQNLSTDQQFYAGESLGLSASTIQLLAKSPEEYRKSLEAAREAAEKFQKDAEERQKLQKELNDFQRRFFKIWADMGDVVLKAYSALPESIKDLTAAIVALSGAVAGLKMIFPGLKLLGMGSAGAGAAVTGLTLVLPHVGAVVLSGVISHFIMKGLGLGGFGTQPKDSPFFWNMFIKGTLKGIELDMKTESFWEGISDFWRKTKSVLDLFNPLSFNDPLSTMPNIDLIGTSPSNSLAIGDITVNVTGEAASSPEGIGNAVAESVAEELVAVLQGIGRQNATVYAG